MALPRLGPLMRLAKLAAPCDDRDSIFEIKRGGYRGVAYLSDGACELVLGDLALSLGAIGCLNGYTR